MRHTFRLLILVVSSLSPLWCAAQPARAALVAASAGIASPTVTIDAPAHNSTTSNPVASVSGTAAGGVASVHWRLNGSVWAATQGATVWTTTCSLVYGVNTIEVRATDPGGNVSPIDAHTLLYLPGAPRLLGGPAIIGGACKALAIKDNLALMGEGTRLHVLDIADRANIRPLGVIDLHEIPVDIAVAGSLAFVAAGGLQIVDFSNPAQPRWRGGYRGAGPASAVAITNGLVYLGSRSSPLLVLDPANPEAPRLCGQSSEQLYATLNIAINGRYAYLSHYASISVYDLAQPDKPVLVASPPFIRSNAAVVVGARVYCADNYYQSLVSSPRSYLRGYDFTDPANPVILGSASFPGSTIGDLQMVGDKVHLVDSTGALKVMDVVSSTTFITSGTLPLGGAANVLALAGGREFVAMNHGLRIIEAGRLLGAYQTIGPVLGIASGDNTLWTAGNARVSAIDLSHPAQPARRSSLDLANLSGRLRLGGGHLIAPVTYNPQGFGAEIIAAANPAAPLRRCRIATDSPTADAAIWGNVAALYVPRLGRLLFYDLATGTPTHLNTLAKYGTDSPMVNMERIGSTLAIAYGFSEVHFLDCADPLAPVPGQLFTPSGIQLPAKPLPGITYTPPYHLAAAGNCLLLTRAGNPPVVLDARNARDIGQLNVLEASPQYYQAAASRGLAAMACGLDNGFSQSAIDLFTFTSSGQFSKVDSMIVPTTPKLFTGHSNSQPYAIGGDIQMLMDGAHFYLAGGDLGLRIYERRNSAMNWGDYE